MKKIYKDFPLETSKKVWSTLQLIFDAVIKVEGGNNYKFPHTGKNRWLHENGEPLSLLLRYTEPTLQTAAEAQPVAQATDQQIVDLTPCAQSPMSVVPDSLFLLEDREEEFEDVKTNLRKVGTSNAMTQLTGILASLQVIDEEIDWEDITENLTWGDNDDHLINDAAEDTM